MNEGKPEHPRPFLIPIRRVPEAERPSVKPIANRYENTTFGDMSLVVRVSRLEESPEPQTLLILPYDEAGLKGLEPEGRVSGEICSPDLRQLHQLFFERITHVGNIIHVRHLLECRRAGQLRALDDCLVSRSHRRNRA